MAGLVGYASSDEDEETENPVSNEAAIAAAPEKKREPEKQAATVTSEAAPANENASGDPAPTKEEPVAIGPVQQNAVPLGPSLPPMEEPMLREPGQDGAPSSPYSANRALLRDLTLPSVPNMDIPPSPPGSPPPGANKKFEQFLDLKKKGVHFNAKLEQSSALKNPSLMDKLLGFVEIDEGGQYETTLPMDLWDPNAFPDWAFKDRLRKSREKLAKEKEAERSSGGRTGIDFVPSTTPAGGSTSTVGGIARGEKRKSGWK